MGYQAEAAHEVRDSGSRKRQKWQQNTARAAAPRRDVARDVSAYKGMLSAMAPCCRLQQRRPAQEAGVLRVAGPREAALPLHASPEASRSAFHMPVRLPPPPRSRQPTGDKQRQRYHTSHETHRWRVQLGRQVLAHAEPQAFFHACRTRRSLPLFMQRGASVRC